MLSRVRKALIFLSINLSPVTLDGLLEFVQIQVEPANTPEGSSLEAEEAMTIATKGLRESLGSLVVTHPISSRFVASTMPGNSVGRDILLVELCHSSLRQLILRESVPTLAFPIIRTFTSTKYLAHRDAAIVCLRVANRSFQSLVCYSYYAVKPYEPPLVHYAYQFWFSHLVASNYTDADAMIVHVEEFRKNLIQDSAALLGSISLAICSDVAGLGPNTGDIPKTAGVVALESSLLRAAKSLQSLLNVPFEPAYRSSQQLTNRSTSSWSFSYRCKAIYRQWKLQDYLSGTALEISKIKLVPATGDTKYETYVEHSLQAVQSLQMLALEISINPIRWQLLQPRKYFSPVVPFLLAAHSLESLTLWPTYKYLKLVTVVPWSVPKDSLLYERLSCAVADILEEPSEKERHRRLKQAKKYYTLRGSNAMIIGFYVALNHGSGLVRSFNAISLNYWLNTRVHLQASITRGLALFGNPAISLSRASREAYQGYDLPRVVDAVLAFPTLLVLTLANGLKQTLRRMKWVIWCGLEMYYNRLRLAYFNYSKVPPLLWTHYRAFIIPGLVMYLLRCKFWPTLGQHWRPNAYRQIQLSIIAPLDWINEQRDWTWWEWIQYQAMYWKMMGLTTGNLFVPRTWPIVWASTHALMAFQQLLILERKVCQIVNATLMVTVPIMVLIQPETTTETSGSIQTFDEVVWRPMAGLSLQIFLLASIRMAIPVMILYYTESNGLLSKLVQPYIISVILPQALVFSVRVWIFLAGLLFRLAVKKDPGEAFLLSLIGAVAIFLILHIEKRVAEDPWGLDITWRGYKHAAKMAQRITGREIMSLEAEIDHCRVRYRHTNNTDVHASTGAKSSHRTGPPSTGEAVEGETTDSVNPSTELHREDPTLLSAGQVNVDWAEQKDKDV